MTEIQTPLRAGSVSRRSFLAGLSAGAFAFGFSFPAPSRALGQTAEREVNAWVVVQPDETVLIRIARIEMGQGALTGLAQLVAEELDCDWSRVRFDLVNPGENRQRQNVWKSQSTGGSQSIRRSHDYLRLGGAQARAILIEAAARSWKVPASQCTTAKGVITHAASGAPPPMAPSPARRTASPRRHHHPESPQDWTLIGQPVKRIDTPDKLNGSLVYGMDFTMPGMLVAVPKACPVHGGKLKSFDAAAISQRPA